MSLPTPLVIISLGASFPISLGTPLWLLADVTLCFTCPAVTRLSSRCGNNNIPQTKVVQVVILMVF